MPRLACASAAQKYLWENLPCRRSPAGVNEHIISQNRSHIDRSHMLVAIAWLPFQLWKYSVYTQPGIHFILEMAKLNEDVEISGESESMNRVRRAADNLTFVLKPCVHPSSSSP
jgi:hypothetical protein